MKKQNSIWAVLTAFLAIVFLVSTAFDAMADGTEVLGPPSIQIASGSGIIASGTGLLAQPGLINIAVPIGATIKQVLLYWEGGSSSLGDSTIIAEDIEVTGTLIGGPITFPSGNKIFGYRADITNLGLIVPGANYVVVKGLTFDEANDGAGILVIFDDGSGTSEIDIRDGLDFAFLPFNEPQKSTVAQTFNFIPSAVDRTATLSMFFASVTGTASGGGFRPTAIEITIGGTTTILDNFLDSVDGQEWDKLNLDVNIPANATSLTVQALSVDNDPPDTGPGGEAEGGAASFSWITGALSVPSDRGGEGCTPGYWKQEQHFDSWTAPYTPGTLFSDVFDNAFPGKTLRYVLKQGGGGLHALGRHTVAALLNAASSDVNYELTVSQVITMFNSVYPGNKNDYTGVKNVLEKFNELGCPLN